jgi:ABC-type transport system involved in cytochrome bd biosynthesis fused ATPase/permease subunit
MIFTVSPSEIVELKLVVVVVVVVVALSLLHRNGAILLSLMITLFLLRTPASTTMNARRL